MKNDRTVMFYFPDVKHANSLRIIQDPTSQIRGFYFTKSRLNDVESLEYANNHAVYFLFSDSDESSVYVGQSVNGINRIKSHLREKDFWQFGILFVADNNSFDKLSIDYLEYYFIQAFSKTQYSLENRDMRSVEPNVNVFNRSTLNSFASHIQFLLEALGVSFRASVPTAIEVEDEVEVFEAKVPYEASIRLADGKFVLQANSIICAPLEHTKDWSDKGTFYKRSLRRYEQLIDSNKAIRLDDATAKLIDDVEFNSPSTPAELCSGRSQNGWMFWDGLNEKRNKEK
ncbi:GIY-YIG nuclease family protein [Sporosarcina sp. ACRSL]|uniref:GIY-YIG nuclease family protein n=1 Tax=Sporosarcina sp. ACRSL TaxID=2918215 RepID=UPI001EF52AF3|nr:GIY-YIG nuclease family protein [Sporosarcina sp. ACRSL]MCG7343409.1 GIY-YIG nuclease family protein [Sporosarcina sp. ACRSL]